MWKQRKDYLNSREYSDDVFLAVQEEERYRGDLEVADDLLKQYEKSKKAIAKDPERNSSEKRSALLQCALNTFVASVQDTVVHERAFDDIIASKWDLRNLEKRCQQRKARLALNTIKVEMKFLDNEISEEKLLQECGTTEIFRMNLSVFAPDVKAMKRELGLA